MQHKRKISLDDIEKQQVYSVPDRYFEDLPANLRRRINGKQVQASPSHFWIKYAIAIASVSLILITLYALLLVPKQQDPYQIITEASETEIIDYLQLSGLSQYDVIEATSQPDVYMDSLFLQQTEIDTELLMDEADRELIHDII